MKRDKYTEAAKELNAEFIPFITTCHGTMGPAASALLEDLEARKRAPLNMDYRLLLSITLQKSMARALLWARQRCEKVGWRSRANRHARPP